MTACVLRHRQPTPAAHGLLCRGHSLAILDLLDDLATWWAQPCGARTWGTRKERN